MTTSRLLASAGALCLLTLGAQAQTPSIEVSADNESAQFAVRGQAQGVYVEVYAPSGELVYEGDSSAGRSIDWTMLNQKGQRVADGVYLAAITVTDSAGKRRKRIEQIVVGIPARAAVAAAAETSAPQESLAPTGGGTSGKIAKWTTANNLGNSIVTEGAGKVGVGTTVAPAATLQVNAAQPAPVANNAVNAPPLLQTSGGAGGSTTVAGAVAGNGAGISLLAGNGGAAPAGSKRGNGGNIVLQPGSAGAGAGTAGVNGNVLIAPSAVGNVGIGTNAPASRLTVNGRIQTTGAGGGIKFSDNTVQTTAATSGLAGVVHNQTLAGDGTTASPLGVAAGGVGATQLANSSVTGAKLALPLALVAQSTSPLLTLTALNNDPASNDTAILANGAIDTSREYRKGGHRLLGTGNYSLFVGLNAGHETTGYNNTFVGFDAGGVNKSGNENAFFGHQAGFFNTDGSKNTFVGPHAGYKNSGGYFNSFFGSQAGFSNTSGHDNTFAGLAAGYNNTTGEANAFFGAASGRANTTGQGNSFFGPNTGYFRATGNYNSFFGTSAGTAGSGVTTGSYNTFLGYNANGTQGINNSTAIGANALVNTSNTVMLGTAGETVNIPGKQSFGAATRQMINLWDTSYGIGVQGSALYFRSHDNFAWFRGGVHHNTLNNPGTGGTLLMRLDSAGNLFTQGAVNPVSARNAKASFSRVNPRFILDKLAAIPIQTWSYKTDADSVRHLGPVAQDFRAAFRLGTDDKHISTVDADGVALASIQALYQMMQDKDGQIERQGSQIAALARTVERQQAQLDQVRRSVRRKRPARR